MLIRDAIQRQGAAFFRYRGKFYLLLLPAWLFALQDSEWLELRFGDSVDDVFDWLCLAISAAGLALRFATAGFVPRRTSGRNTRKGQVAEVLNSTGLYSIVRHPLYVANTVILCGFLLATGSLWLTAVGLLACCLLYERVACGEEAFLAERFGSAYLAWVERTPAFVPRPSLWVAPSWPFSWRTAIKREYLSAFLVVGAFTLSDYAEDLMALGRLELELETTVLFVGTAAAFLGIRVLRKHTRVLHISGR